MRYGITRAATDFTVAGMNDWRVRLAKALLFFIPRANPDNERLYHQVTAWALELSDDGLPQREVGVSATGDALFRSPEGRNTGLWTDIASQKFSLEELEPLSEGEFFKLWSSAPPTGEKV